jgi:hypothetical protein
MKTHNIKSADVVALMLDLIKNAGGVVVEHTDSRIVIQTTHTYLGSDRHVIIGR